MGVGVAASIGEEIVELLRVEVVGQPPEFDGTVDDGRPRQQHPALGLERVDLPHLFFVAPVPEDLLGAGGLGILEVVGLVADQHVPDPLAELGLVLGQDVVVDDHDIRIGPLATDGDADGQVFVDQPLLGFALPVEAQAGRDDDEDFFCLGRGVDDTQCLNRFAQTHLITDEDGVLAKGELNPGPLIGQVFEPFGLGDVGGGIGCAGCGEGALAGVVGPGQGRLGGAAGIVA